MEIPKRFLHDRLVLLLVTAMALLVAIGVATVLIRFDVSKNPTTIVAYRPNISGSSYQSGKPIDIYSLAIFMIFTAAPAVILAMRTYNIKRNVAIFTLASANFLLLLAVVVANSLISLQ